MVSRKDNEYAATLNQYRYYNISCEVTHHEQDVLLLSLHIIALISTLIAKRHSWFLTGETKLLWTHDATLCRVTATLDTRHERQTFFWPILAIFWPTFLQFRTRVIRNRYWYWWHMNETRFAFVEPDVTHHFVMGYRIFMTSSVKLHCFISFEKAVWAYNALCNDATGKSWADIFLMAPSFFYIEFIYLYTILQYFYIFFIIFSET